MSAASAKQARLFSIGEFGLIELLKKKLHVSSDIIKGIDDDAAVMTYSAKEYLLLTTDMIVEDVHFRRTDNPVWIGQKAISCNVSDIAAMGGIPKFAVVSIGLPINLAVSYVTKIYQGLEKRAKEFGVVIVGGDTVRSDKIIINVALTGIVEKRNLVLRSGAQKGDFIFVSGKLGKSLSTKHHLAFKPRLKESQFLVKHCKPTSMIDISDGLAPDLGHILKQSQAGARLKEGKIPRRLNASLKEALYDGEDFELLFTVSPKQLNRSIRIPKEFSFTHIGEITGRSGEITLVDQKLKVRRISTKGFEHF